MDNQSMWPAIVKVNLRFAGAMIALFYSWLCWQAASSEWWAFWFIAVIGFIGGGVEFIRALFEAVGIIRALGWMNRFKRQGTEPRADREPDRDDLKDEGMIR